MTAGELLQALIGALENVVELTGGVMLHPGTAYRAARPDPGWMKRLPLDLEADGTFETCRDVAAARGAAVKALARLRPLAGSTDTRFPADRLVEDLEAAANRG